MCVCVCVCCNNTRGAGIWNNAKVLACTRSVMREMRKSFCVDIRTEQNGTYLYEKSRQMAYHWTISWLFAVWKQMYMWNASIWIARYLIKKKNVNTTDSLYHFSMNELEFFSLFCFIVRGSQWKCQTSEPEQKKYVCSFGLHTSEYPMDSLTN